VSVPLLEAFLTRIYVDAAAREKFLQDPAGEGMRAGLSAEEVESLAQIDRVGLELMADSLKCKRERQSSVFNRRDAESPS
jgi:hypothetical protein